MADVSTDTSSTSDGMHELKLTLNDTEVLSVTVGLKVLGKAPGAGANWMDSVKNYLSSALGLDKLLGKSGANEDASAPSA